MLMTGTYAVYLTISVAITVGVGHTLHKHGRWFLLDVFSGDEQLADTVNHLLLVGFYLLNIGWVCLALHYGPAVANLREAIDLLSIKVGVVLVLLGGMHFVNLMVLCWIRKRLHCRRFHSVSD